MPCVSVRLSHFWNCLNITVIFILCLSRLHYSNSVTNLLDRILNLFQMMPVMCAVFCKRKADHTKTPFIPELWLRTVTWDAALFAISKTLGPTPFFCLRPFGGSLTHLPGVGLGLPSAAIIIAGLCGGLFVPCSLLPHLWPLLLCSVKPLGGYRWLLMLFGMSTRSLDSPPLPPW